MGDAESGNGTNFVDNGDKGKHCATARKAKKKW